MGVPGLDEAKFIKGFIHKQGVMCVSGEVSIDIASPDNSVTVSVGDNILCDGENFYQLICFLYIIDILSPIDWKISVNKKSFRFAKGDGCSLYSPVAWGHISHRVFNFIRKCNAHSILWPSSVLIILYGWIDNKVEPRDRLDKSV